MCSAMSWSENDVQCPNTNIGFANSVGEMVVLIDKTDKFVIKCSEYMC